MSTSIDVNEFLALKKLAIVGLSRDPKSFSALALAQLQAGGYQVFAINPNTTEAQGLTCYPDPASLPEAVEGAIVFTPPAVSAKVLPQLRAAGITRVWLQQGTSDQAVLAYCREQGMQVVSDQCIMMFAPPVKGIHKFHRGFKRIFGGLP